MKPLAIAYSPPDMDRTRFSELIRDHHQPLLAYADRDRIIPPEIRPLKLTLSGDCTVTVDGRVAASWRMDGPKLLIKPHTDFDHTAVRDEALRTARFCAENGEVAFE